MSGGLLRSANEPYFGEVDAERGDRGVTFDNDPLEVSFVVSVSVGEEADVHLMLRWSW